MVNPLIFYGYIICPKCAGSGRDVRLLNGNLVTNVDCNKCNGEGMRIPTWTEEILYKKELKKFKSEEK